MKAEQTETRLEHNRATPLRFLFVRVFWVALGPAVMLGLLVSIVTSGTGWLTVRDGAFFAVLAATIGLRRYDYHFGDRTLPTGEQATEADIRRHTVLWSAGGVAVWIVANVLGNHLLGS